MLGQLHLQTALVGTGPPGEDVQYQRGAVDDLDAEGFFQVLLLGRRKLVIQDDRRVGLSPFMRSSSSILPLPT